MRKVVPTRKGVALVSAGVAASALLVWFGASVVAGPRMMYVSLDPPRPTQTPQPVPTSFNEAGRMACERYVVDYKLWLCVRLNEMGRRNLEMGLPKRGNAAIESAYPFFTQAYWAAYILAKRQKEFAADKGLQERFASLGQPFVGYFCFRWNPGKGWRNYYWDKENGGVAAAYYHYSKGQLEKMIEKKAVELFGDDW